MNAAKKLLIKLARRVLVPELALRVLALENKVDFQFELIMRLIDLVHERDRERAASDKVLHQYVQTVAQRTGVALAAHRKDIAKLVQLTTGKPTEELIDMKATNVWKVPKT